MKDIKGKLAFGIICAIFGLILAVQIKTVRSTPGGSFLSPQRAQKVASELKVLRNEKDRLNQELSELENRLKEYEISEADENIIIRNLKNDLEKYQILAGYRSIEGPGIVLTIEDVVFQQGEASFIMFNFEILLELVNKLNAAGAEAIAINEQRYVANTEIYFTSNTIFINGVPTAQPYTIKAIGDAEALEAALNMRFGIIDKLKQYHNESVKVTVKKQNPVIITRNSKVTNFKFAKPIESTQL